MDLKSEIRKRRTFAIISHPDAGKTTLTEKLLLFGGAIQTAGAVRSNKIRKTTTSDFMEIEKQRGISVSTSVMAFDYNNIRVNILDTPGHKDFAEDTYRTLSAVDSVILVVDCVKGVEEQTRKLMEVCRMRNTPVMIFVNKMDREGIYPFDLLDELERELKITVCPYTWPIGNGKQFKGVYNLFKEEVQIYAPEKSIVSESFIKTKDIQDPKLRDYVGIENINRLWEEIDFIKDMFESFNMAFYREGYLAPLFFGSALNNFGKGEFFIYQKFFYLFNFMVQVILLNGCPFNFRKKIRKVCVIVMEFFAQVIRKVYFDLFVSIMNHFNDNCFYLLNQYAFIIIYQFKPGLLKGKVQKVQLLC